MGNNSSNDNGHNSTVVIGDGNNVTGGGRCRTIREVSSKVVEIQLECSPDAFFKFFKEEAHKLPKACSSIVPKIELHDGTKSWVDTVGSRKLIFLKSSTDTSENIKYQVVAVDDISKKITFKVLEGKILHIYSTFTVTLEVTVDSTAKWTIVCEKQSAPNPDVSLDIFSDLSIAVDAYIGLSGEA